MGSNDTLRLMGVSDPSGKGEIWGSNPEPKHENANCCCYMGNGNEEHVGMHVQGESNKNTLA